MSVAFYVMVISGIGLIIAFLLFRAESINGRFFLKKLRDDADARLQKSAHSFFGVKRVLGASSLRLLLHFVLHQVLGAILFTVRFIERRLHSLRVKNRVVAKDLRAQNEDSHLFHIARHKDATSLSAEERERLKERSLRD